MERDELIKRAEDLADRCDRTGRVTVTSFLTPAEQHELRLWAERHAECRVVFSGGGADCERQAAFFLPFWMEADDLDLGEYLRAVRIDAYFGEPGHRDYLGAAMGLGIRREWLGDFRIFGATAYVFCLPTVEGLLVNELDRAGRVSVKASPCPLEEVPALEREVRRVSFTVKSLRLDAVAAYMFGLSRTAAAEMIRLGAANLNYVPCERVDAAVKEGDVISLRGKGKGLLSSVGGRSRKDRLFLEAEIYL